MLFYGIVIAMSEAKKQSLTFLLLTHCRGSVGLLQPTKQASQ